jgi:hypothetical protein
MVAEAAQRDLEEKLDGITIKRLKESEGDDSLGEEVPSDQNRLRMNDVYLQQESPVPDQDCDSLPTERCREEYHRGPPARPLDIDENYDSDDSEDVQMTDCATDKEGPFSSAETLEMDTE